MICSIKAELVRPPLYENSRSGGGGGRGGGGVIELNVDLLPYASYSTERRDIKKEQQEVVSILSRLLLDPLLDYKGDGSSSSSSSSSSSLLVVKEGKYVWRLNIDILVIHCDGNLVDCCSMVILGALKNLKLPRVVAVEHAMDGPQESSSSGSGSGKRAALDELLLDSDVANSIKIQQEASAWLDACPIVVTVCLMPIVVDGGKDKSGKRLNKKNDCVMVVDADRQEEMASCSKVSVSVDQKGNICGIHKYGTSSAASSSVLGGGWYTSGNIKMDMLSKIQNVAVSCSQTVFSSIVLKKKENDYANKDVAGTDVALWSNAEDEYTNFFKSQFELQ
jgi:RNase PH-related exoribonuclease